MQKDEGIQPFASIENLGKLKAYKLSRELSKKVWIIVQKWDWFAKTTIGVQWVRATDSISEIFPRDMEHFFSMILINFTIIAEDRCLNAVIGLARPMKEN